MQITEEKPAMADNPMYMGVPHGSRRLTRTCADWGVGAQTKDEQPGD